MQRFKQPYEVNHPLARREVQVIRGGIAPAIVVEMNVLDSFRELFNEAQAPVLLTKEFPVA
jgi:hypothetical protein